MIDPDKRKAIFLLHEEGMTNGVNALGEAGGEAGEFGGGGDDDFDFFAVDLGEAEAVDGFEADLGDGTEVVGGLEKSV